MPERREEGGEKLIINVFLMEKLKRAELMRAYYKYLLQNILSMSESSYSLEEQSDSSAKRPYHRVTQEDKGNLFKEVFQNRMKITKAAKKIGLNLSTAKFLIKRYKRQHNISSRTKDTPPPQSPPATQQSAESSGFQPFCYLYFTPQVMSWGADAARMPYGACFPSF